MGITDTTPTILTPKVRDIQLQFDNLIKHAPVVDTLRLKPAQYQLYLDAVQPQAKMLAMANGLKYRGRTIKKYNDT